MSIHTGKNTPTHTYEKEREEERGREGGSERRDGIMIIKRTTSAAAHTFAKRLLHTYLLNGHHLSFDNGLVICESLYHFIDYETKINGLSYI